MTEPMIRFTGVAKRYDGDALVVDNLNLDIRRGEFLTFLGPSGSGKTTTLMMLAGFEDPSAGTIVMDGKTLNHVPPHKRGIGMVFQNYALFPHMTVAQNLAFPLEMQNLSKAEIAPRVARALEMVRLSDLGSRRPNQLSGGQQQRIALARALIFEPKLVLMDEPLGALDKQLREQLQLEIKHIHERLGVTVVYVTHDQSEALTMSDRIAVFHQGVVQQLGTPAEIYDRPANSFVASFIGENNRMDGRVIDHGADGTRTALADGTVIVSTPAPALVPGAAVVLSVRPERVVTGPAADATANRIATAVEEIIYLGDHTRLRVRVGDQPDFYVKVAHGEGPTRYAKGDAVIVGWHARACIALPGDATLGEPAR